MQHYAITIFIPFFFFFSCSSRIFIFSIFFSNAYGVVAPAGMYGSESIFGSFGIIFLKFSIPCDSSILSADALCVLFLYAFLFCASILINISITSTTNPTLIFFVSTDASAPAEAGLIFLCISFFVYLSFLVHPFTAPPLSVCRGKGVWINRVPQKGVWTSRKKLVFPNPKPFFILEFCTLKIPKFF